MGRHQPESSRMAVTRAVASIAWRSIEIRWLPWLLLFVLFAGPVARAVQFSASSSSVQLRSVETVSISVSDFSEVYSFQFSIQWDPQALEFVETADYGLDALDTGSFSTNSVALGRLGVLWTDDKGRGTNLPNASVVFSLKFRAVGTAGTSPTIQFGDDPTPAEVLAGSTLEIQNPVMVPGAISILVYPAQVTWNVPASIPFGTPLGLEQLNAFADVPGSFVYNPASGTVLKVGTYSLSVVFTPDDAVNFSGASVNVPLTVDAVNGLPTLDAIPDPPILIDSSIGSTIGLSGISAGAGENQSLRVVAVSGNPGLIPDPVVVYASPAATGSLSYTPVPGQSGNAVITATVIDAGLDGDIDTTADNGSFSRSFVVTVNAPPTVVSIGILSGASEDAVFGIGHTVLADAADETDADGDFVSFRLEAVSSGILTKGGAAIQPGVTLLSAGESFEWTPDPNAYGILDAFILRAWDGLVVSSAAVQVRVSVAAINDSPTMVVINDPVAVNEDSGLQTIALAGIGSGGGETQAISISASSNNPGLIPTPSVNYISPNTTGSVSYTPVANQSGTAEITVTVMDAGLDGDLNSSGDNLSVTRTFTVTVNAVNDLPAVSQIDDQTINEDGTTGLIVFSVSDIETPAGDLGVTAQSSNSLLVPVSGLELGGSGANRTLTIRPVTDAFGTTTVTVNVTDAHGGMVTETFLVTVNAINDSPTLTVISDPVAVNEDSGVQTITLSGIGSGGGELQAIAISASSNNPGLIPTSSVNYTSPNTTGSVSYTPVANQSGTAVITVTVVDSGLDGDLNSGGDNLSISRTFTVTVNPVNDPPTLAVINDPVAISEDSGTQTIPLTGIGAGGGETQAISISASSNNPGLIPTPSVNYSSPNTTGSVSYTPVANQSGTAVITVTVVDSGLDGDLNSGGDNLSVTRTFTLTVNAVNDLPTLDEISDPAPIQEDAGGQTVSLSGISSGGGEPQTVLIGARSS
ncbi:MAG: hypothetical protein K9N62_12560, partial [Verrucomicrobia bacterium]|nr:hypothetical protein [Verrucomicrobiota bacterium]